MADAAPPDPAEREPYDHLKVCAAGRWISHLELWGGLDWQRPCAAAAGEKLPLGQNEYGFCQAHYDVIIEDLARALGLDR